jgi:hypothetical protein
MLATMHLSSRQLSKNLNIETYQTIFVSVVIWVCDMGCDVKGRTQIEVVWNKVLWTSEGGSGKSRESCIARSAILCALYQVLLG